jgi:hypothetical protein
VELVSQVVGWLVSQSVSCFLLYKDHCTTRVKVYSSLEYTLVFAILHSCYLCLSVIYCKNRYIIDEVGQQYKYFSE